MITRAELKRSYDEAHQRYQEIQTKLGAARGAANKIDSEIAAVNEELQNLEDAKDGLEQGKAQFAGWCTVSSPL